MNGPISGSYSYHIVGFVPAIFGPTRFPVTKWVASTQLIREDVSKLMDGS